MQKITVSLTIVTFKSQVWTHNPSIILKVNQSLLERKPKSFNKAVDCIQLDKWIRFVM